MRVPGSVVADITYDSLLDDSVDEDADRKLAFTAGDVEVTVVVRPAGHDVNLVVNVEPQGAVESVQCVGSGDTVPVGRQTSAVTLKVEQGLNSFILRPTRPGGRLVQTAWVSL
jgi:hypothetical protein